MICWSRLCRLVLVLLDGRQGGGRGRPGALRLDSGRGHAAAVARLAWATYARAGLAEQREGLLQLAGAQLNLRCCSGACSSCVWQPRADSAAPSLHLAGRGPISSARVVSAAPRDQRSGVLLRVQHAHRGDGPLDLPVQEFLPLALAIAALSVPVRPSPYRH
jgi:hypothetical protein